MSTAERSSREIPLTQGQIAIVDAIYYDAMAQHKWYARYYRSAKTYYAVRNAPTVHGKRGPSIWMHREILDAPVGVEVDHRDHNGLNNRRTNLRLATKFQNQHNRRTQRNNTSGYKGVTLDPSGKWRAQIRVDGVNRHLGLFLAPESAHAAYIDAAVRLRGEFASGGAL